MRFVEKLFRMVQKLTIPETAFDPEAFTSHHKRTSLFKFLLRLTHGSGILLTVIYIVSYFGIKPLIETATDRKLQIFDKYRHTLRDLYLRIISKVDYIPIVGVSKTNDGIIKVKVDTITQTETSYLNRTIELSNEDKLEQLNSIDKLNQIKLVAKLTKLNDSLSKCTSYNIGEIPHYKKTRDEVQAFQKLVDTQIFNYDDLYTVTYAQDGTEKLKNLVIDTKNDIRSIKGLYLTGQV